ncbi:MAG: sensor histidine kinase [Sulfuricaulis sp.]
MKTTASRAARRIALLYLLCAGIWLGFADQFMTMFVSEPRRLMWWQTSIDLGFIVVTTLLLYVALRYELMERQRADTHTQNQLAMLQALYTGARQLSASLDVSLLAKSVTRSCVEHFGARLAWLGCADADGAVRPLGFFPGDSRYMRDLEVRWDESPIGQGPTGRAIRSGEPVIIADILTDPRMLPWRQLAQSEGMRTSAALPLSGHDKIIGVFSVYSDQPGFFIPERMEFFQAYAQQAGATMENALLHAQVRHNADDLQRRVEERTAQLEESNEALEIFTHSVSHDLRAPLRGIQGFVQALQQDYAGQLDARGQEYTRRIITAATRMDKMIQDLFDFSRLSSADLTRKPVMLSTVVAEALEQLQTERQQRGADITISGELPAVLGHHATLVQVVSNLLSNAIKFVAAGITPRVRVWCEPRTPGIRLWVEDNGIGIAVEQQALIFKMFERLHGEETFSGSGVGLAIVCKGMERLGGSAGVESAQGSGSRFWVELPAANGS